MPSNVGVTVVIAPDPVTRHLQPFYVLKWRNNESYITVKVIQLCFKTG